MPAWARGYSNSRCLQHCRGAVAAGITLQMVSEGAWQAENAEWWVWAPGLKREALISSGQ